MHSSKKKTNQEERGQDKVNHKKPSIYLIKDK